MAVRRARSKAVLVALVAGASSLGGCTLTQRHQGYVVDTQLINSVAPGIDNRDSVQKTLGRPSLASEFDGGATWYYFARQTKEFAFGGRFPVSQTLLTVRFAPNGDVTAVQKTGLETVRNVSLYGKKTPTLGRSYSFFEELFGNIGTVGAAGAAPTADNPGGGGPS